MSTTLEEIGSRMLIKRKEQGYSQAKTAAILDVSDRSYKSYELGKRDMSFATAMKFAGRFQVSLDWLAFDQGEQQLKRTDDLVLKVSHRCFDQIKRYSKDVSADQFKSYVDYIVEQTRKNQSDPTWETDNFLKTIGIIDDA